MESIYTIHYTISMHKIRYVKHQHTKTQEIINRQTDRQTNKHRSCNIELCNDKWCWNLNMPGVLLPSCTRLVSSIIRRPSKSLIVFHELLPFQNEAVRIERRTPKSSICSYIGSNYLAVQRGGWIEAELIVWPLVSIHARRHNWNVISLSGLSCLLVLLNRHMSDTLN